MGSSGIAFPLYRLTGGNVNWEKLLKKGLPGMIAELDEKIFEKKSEQKPFEFFEAAKIALEILIDVCRFYSV